MFSRKRAPMTMSSDPALSFHRLRAVFRVSIPFKREGLSEPKNSVLSLVTETKFQFPSSGKDFLNHNELIIERNRNSVSIPFKREGLSEPLREKRQREEKNSFNSLQAGRTF